MSPVGDGLRKSSGLRESSGLRKASVLRLRLSMVGCGPAALDLNVTDQFVYSLLAGLLRSESA